MDGLSKATSESRARGQRTVLALSTGVGLAGLTVTGLLTVGLGGAGTAAGARTSSTSDDQASTASTSASTSASSDAGRVAPTNQSAVASSGGS